MTNNSGMKILVAFDGSACAEAMLDDLQRAGLPAQTEVLVLTVAEEWIPAPPSIGGVETGFLQDELAAQEKSLTLAQQTAQRVQQSFPGWKVTADVRLGSPASEIIAQADAWRPHLIVVGAHGRTALGRFFFGSVSQKVVNEAHCSVRVARGRVVSPPDTPARIIVGVDGSVGAVAAVNEIAARHWPYGGEVRIVNAAWTIPPVAKAQAVGKILEWAVQENERVQKMMDEAAEKLRAAGLQVSAMVQTAEPKGLLCSEAESLNADCIFVGAKGMSKLERMLTGSISAGVAARAHCSVEIVRG